MSDIKYLKDQLKGIQRYDVHQTKSQEYLQNIALDVALQWDGSDDNLTQRVALALYEAIGEIQSLVAEVDALEARWERGEYD